MGFSDLCNTGLVLGLGLSAVESKKVDAKHDQNLEEEEEEDDDDHLGCKKMIISEHHHHQPQTSLTLSLSTDHHRTSRSALAKRFDADSDNISTGFNVQLSGDVLITAANSSLSNVSGVKRERDVNGSGDLEIETKISSSSRVVVDEFDDDDDGSNGRKKLRLTKAQSALLEESFKHHSSLNPKQKQDLARDLKLRPRQVEVWFQNRRARTKLKQTEMDYALLKKCCETLTEENRRLQKEVQELKALKLAQSPLYMKIPPATLAVCPSCGGGSGEGVAKSAFTMALKPHFCNPPLTNPSSAC